VVLLLKPSVSVPTHNVVRQISKALGAKFLVVILELQSANRGLRHSVGGLARFAFLGIEHALLLVVAIVAIGLTVALIVEILLHGLALNELKPLIGGMVFSIGAIVWMGRSFIVNWRVGRAVDLVRAKQYSHVFGWVPRTMKIRMSERVWREAVEHIGEECECLLIDLSQDVDQVTWEIDHVTKKWAGRAAILLNEQAAIPVALKTQDLPIVRYSPGHGAWQNFAIQLRKTLASFVATPSTLVDRA
jgi:hypothetical protein